jgi:hypothetical protein
MNALYGWGASTIWKYIKIICGILSSRDGLFNTYIHAPIGNKLQDIINIFKDVTRLPNICGTINDAHIPLTRRPSSHIIPWAFNFFSMKKFHNIVLHVVCDMKMFWNVCAGQPGGVYDVGQFQWSSLY